MNINSIYPMANDVNTNQNIQPINQDKRPENIDRSQISTAINIQKTESSTQDQLENQLKDSLKNTEELKKILEELQNKISYLNKSLKIELNEEIKQPVVKIVDITNNQVIRQIPPDYVINIIRNINKMLGALVNEKA